MNKRKLSGFSLIELVIVVGLVALISMIATGFYGDYVTSSNRTDARTILSQTAASLEKCKSLYANYNSGNCNVFAATVTSDNGYYTVAATAVNSSDFIITANPVAGGPQASDTDCLTMTLSNTGLKGGTPAGNECW